MLMTELIDQAIKETIAYGHALCLYSSNRTRVRIYARDLGPAQDQVFGSVFNEDDGCWYTGEWDQRGASLDGDSVALIAVPRYWVLEIDDHGAPVAVLPLDRHLAVPERAGCSYLTLTPVEGSPSPADLAERIGLPLPPGVSAKRGAR